MAMNTYMTFLMHSTDGSSYTDLVPIKDYPDFLNEVNTIDVTNLQNSMHTYIAGLLDVGGTMDFTCNYSATDYQTVKALDDGTEKYLAIWFGGTESGGTITPNGVDGKWTFKGMIKVGISGKGVDEAREMIVHVVPGTDMTFSVGTSA
jgi:hypothetical protein